MIGSVTRELTQQAPTVRHTCGMENSGRAKWIAGIAVVAGVATIAALMIGDIPSLIDRLNSSPPVSSSAAQTGDEGNKEPKPEPTVSESEAPSRGPSPTPTQEVPATPQSVYIADLDPVDVYDDGAYSYDEGMVGINGESYPRSVFDIDLYNRTSLTYDLGRDYRRFESTAGVLDSAKSGTRVRVEAYVDEVLVYSADTSIGAPAVLSLDVSNALRLRLDLYNLAPDASRRADAGFGDGRLS